MSSVIIAFPAKITWPSTSQQSMRKFDLSNAYSVPKSSPRSTTCELTCWPVTRTTSLQPKLLLASNALRDSHVTIIWSATLSQSTRKRRPLSARCAPINLLESTTFQSIFWLSMPKSSPTVATSATRAFYSVITWALTLCRSISLLSTKSRMGANLMFVPFALIASSARIT